MSILDLRPPEWQERAACQDIGFELYFTDISGTRSSEERAAQKACETCEVRSQCLQFAVDNRIEYGVYGGMTARPRRALWAPASEAS